MPFQLQDPYDVSMGDTGTPRGIPSAPPMPEAPPTPVFNPQAGAPPPVPPAMPPTAPVAPPPQDNELSNYLAQQKAGLQKYGPEQQMAVEQDILKRRQSLPQVAGNAMTGFADALMQGVARAGPGQFQQNLQNRNQQTEQGMRGAMEKAQSGKMAQIKAQNDLMATDPNSPLSKVAQRANASTLLAAGVPKEAISFMPASLIGEIGNKNVTLLDDKQKMMLEQSYRMAGLDLQAQQIRATIGNQKSERRLAGAKGLSDRSWLQKSAELVPFVKSDATKVFQQEASGEPGTVGGAPQSTSVHSHADYQALPPGTHYVDSQGNHGVKK